MGVMIAISLAAAIYFFGFRNSGKEDADLSNFNIVFRYGTSGRYGIDTFRGLIYKDRVMAGIAEAKFKISDIDSGLIKQRINELRLKNIDPLVAGTRNLCPAGVPADSFYLKVQDGVEVWEKAWYDCEKEIAPPFQEFSAFMSHLIESKMEFKLMPGAVGGYM